MSMSAEPPFVPRFQGRRLCGFTLLELLVVLVIVGLLSGYVGPRLFVQLGKAEHKTAGAQISALQKALDQYRIDVGSYPSSAQGLQALMQRGNQARWSGPYLTRSVPPDPWGRPYIYRSPGQHGEYDLFSLGSDGRPGGSNADADVTSW